MYKDDKISSYQHFTLFTAFMLGSSLILNPAIAAKSDAWLAFLIGLAGGSLLIMGYICISRLNPSMTLIAILKNNFGSVFGTLLGILYIWYFIHLASMVLRTFGEYSLTVTYAETPILFVIGCFALSISLAVRSGIETLGRISEILLLITVIVITFVTILITNSFQIDNLKPFLSKGLKPVFMSAFGVMSLPIGECVVFLMIFPNINRQKKVFSATMLSVLCFGACILILTLRNIMVLGGNTATRDIFSSVTILKQLPAVESVPLLDLNYILVGVVKVGILVYAAVTGIAELFDLKEYRPFVFPLTVFVVSLSNWIFESFLENLKWAANSYPIYASLFQIILPILILSFSLVNHKKKGKMCGSQADS